MVRVIEDKVQNQIKRFRASGLTKAADYLQDKATRSINTASSFSFGLLHLNSFIKKKYNDKHDIQTILPLLLKEQRKHDGEQKLLYELLRGFVSYLQNDSKNGHSLTPKTIRDYMVTARSYLGYNNIDISIPKFKRRVTMPAIYREDEAPIDSNDIKNILNHCNNRRLKAYILVLASSGTRAVEALGIRLRDINNGAGIDLDKFSPTEILIRKQYTKIRRERRIYISDEASSYLKQWIEYKHRDRHKEHHYLKNIEPAADDLVFSKGGGITKPAGLYDKMLDEFHKVLKDAGFKDRKEDGVYKRRKVTLHSFRRFVKTTIADHYNSDFSEYMLGHSKSVYYVNKLDEYRKEYKKRCMSFLTFLSDSTAEAIGKDYEAKLEQKEIEIERLNQQVRFLESRDASNADRIAGLEMRLQEVFDLVLGKDRYKPSTPEQEREHLKKDMMVAWKISDQRAEDLIRRQEAEERIEKQTKTR